MNWQQLVLNPNILVLIRLSSIDFTTLFTQKPAHFSKDTAQYSWLFNSYTKFPANDTQNVRGDLIFGLPSRIVVPSHAWMWVTESNLVKWSARLIYPCL